MTPLTEADVLELLRQRHTRPGNGGSGEYAFLTHVRNEAGFDATRTFDAVAIALWPSRGHLIDVFEVKVSRSDWLRELANPQKAADACRVADRFWIVAPTSCFVKDEVPPSWGILEVVGNAAPWRLRVRRPAKLHLPGGHRYVPPPLSRSFAVALLRAAPGAVPGGRRPLVDQEASR